MKIFFSTQGESRTSFWALGVAALLVETGLVRARASKPVEASLVRAGACKPVEARLVRARGRGGTDEEDGGVERRGKSEGEKRLRSSV